MLSVIVYYQLLSRYEYKNVIVQSCYLSVNVSSAVVLEYGQQSSIRYSSSIEL